MKNLLVVDDSATARMLISLTLKKGVGYNILEAADGTEAVTRLESGQIDLVLTDVKMPKMDGLELITYIRVHTLARPELPRHRYFDQRRRGRPRPRHSIGRQWVHSRNPYREPKCWLKSKSSSEPDNPTAQAKACLLDPKAQHSIGIPPGCRHGTRACRLAAVEPHVQANKTPHSLEPRS